MALVSLSMKTSRLGSFPPVKVFPDVTITTLSTPSFIEPPLPGLCGIRSNSGINAGNDVPVVDRVIHTARARTIPIAHRTSFRLNVPLAA